MANYCAMNTLAFDPELCTNCGRCAEVCPHGVFAAGAERADLVKPEDCMECGACALNCPAGAIEVESGVGCAWAMIAAALRGKKGAACGDGGCCGGDGDSGCRG